MVNLCVMCILPKLLKKKGGGREGGERKKKHAMQRPSEKLERDQAHSSEPLTLGQRS